MSHPRSRLDEVIHSPVRFSVVAALASATSIEFRVLRDLVEVSDSVLSKQIATLEEAEYVGVTKFRVGRRTRTSLSLTSQGRKAFEQHVQALRDIAEGLDLPLPDSD
ncbi:transcriptional regulator [Nocardiopsis exhalans]|uniref:DNA-binding MarR family transcriptional regulator n=2 Tax=Nocardiopsis TaxID=2013 RepID=A0A840W4I2_9ACTN|nr:MULTISPECIES: transcriptional regulator [Nocardiopsis]MBB5490972.1 DNA-binding MarR family transcriptional regulator [Nocardiopsis metallicus]QRN79851.1 MAG: transcriptional regulator [Nocardiopsis sp. BM-2018]USY17570.1 transcriptional regulator [Nocardiopsis exhalans]